MYSYKKESFTSDAEIKKFTCESSDLLNKVSNAIEKSGVCIIEDVFTASFMQDVRDAMYDTKESIVKTVGEDKLEYAGEMGVLRTPMKFNDIFFKILENKTILSIVDRILSDTAILHLQNGFILPSFKSAGETPKKFQNSFHMDFKRVLNGYMSSLNILLLVSDFNKDNGGTLAVPGSHQMSVVPEIEELEANSNYVEGKSGSILIFDSTLWHAAGKNISGADRLGINHQFTRSFFKQQIDYPRALGSEKIAQLPDRTQQLLGYYTRIPAGLDEYYVPSDQRLYRANQG